MRKHEESCTEHGGRRDPKKPLPPSQAFPDDGPLGKNLSAEALRRRIREGKVESETVYCYIVASIHDGWVQNGNSPNWQGGVITLCACKHYMRTFLRNVDDWKGKWVAGFTGINVAGNRKNALVYLMKVDGAFPSFVDLWTSGSLGKRTLMAKEADRNPCGDLYRPKRKGVGDPFDPLSYHGPRPDGVHHKVWHRDIAYEGILGRHPALLVGRQKLSFLWSEPSLYYKSTIHRGQKKTTIAELLHSIGP
jgi:Nucleotide modification associated domain 2